MMMMVMLYQAGAFDDCAVIQNSLFSFVPPVVQISSSKVTPQLSLLIYKRYLKIQSIEYPLPTIHLS